MSFSAQNDAPWSHVDATPFRESQSMQFEFKRSLMAASFHLETHIDNDGVLRSIAKVRARVPLKGEFNFTAKSSARVESDQRLSFLEYEELDQTLRPLIKWKADATGLHLYVAGGNQPSISWSNPSIMEIADPLTLLSFIDLRGLESESVRFQTLMGKKVRVVELTHGKGSDLFASGRVISMDAPQGSVDVLTTVRPREKIQGKSQAETSASFELRFASAIPKIETVSFRVPFLGELALRRYR